MLKLYSEINTEKIALVHGESKSKLCFSKELQEEISKKIKHTKFCLSIKVQLFLL